MNNGILAEAKVTAHLIELGYDVFNQFGGKAPFDIVAHKDRQLYRVSVKSTSVMTRSGKFQVQIGRVRPNRTESVIYKYDPDEADLVAIYILPVDRVVILDAKAITTGRMLTVSADMEGWQSPVMLLS